MQALWQDIERVLLPFLNGLPQAVLTTVSISLAACLLGMALAVVLLLARTSGFWPLKALVVVFVSAMRGIPLLIQLLVVYYALPAILNLSISAVNAGVLALAMNTSAYISEILRGVLSSLPAGQRAAAFSLGMGTWSTWRYILLPQIFFKALPPLTNEWTVMVKASSLLSVISVVEISALARNVNLQTNAPLSVFGASALIYFVLLFLLSSASRKVEQRIAVRVGRHA
ncbi:amino acid ABC transporter [Lampropedia cohaerens]|uniref:Amino acid ABC transporter n=1 Tax=Lampropedia cohaerens TaxID=1610491 RepID=A0A0U1Q354_9BURK|nr:amino acid ABC transporter permease [Lampropedia cohaerens]KKW69065.1 amino acid ABC transporter [Lampropedia cohaerens]